MNQQMAFQSGKSRGNIKISIVFILLLFIIGASPYVETGGSLRLIQGITKGVCIVIYFFETIKHLTTLLAQRAIRYTLLFILIILLYLPFATDPKLGVAPLFVLLSFPFFYSASLNNEISSQQIQLFLWSALVLATNNVLQYYYKLDAYLIEDIYEGNFTNNSSYTIALLFPFFFLIKRRPLNWLLVIPAFLLVLVAQKRGAILCASIFLLSYLYISLRRSKTITRFISLLVAILLIYIVYSGSTFFFHRFVEGNTSGRNEMYSFYLSSWMDGSFLRLLFGNGFYATMDLSFYGRHLYAHSDFVEVIYDFGLLGLCIYCSIIISILRFGFRQRKRSREVSFFILSTMLIFILKASISGVYLDVGGNLLFITLGILMGRSSSHLKSLSYQTRQNERINTR